MALQINPTAFGPVRAVVAELVVGQWFSDAGADPVLFGGNRRGHDIVVEDDLIDVKLLVATSRSERAKDPGWSHKLRRDDGRDFDSARTTHLVLVEFPPDWSAEALISPTQTSITISHDGVRLYWIPVADLNFLLADARESTLSERWSFLLLEDEWLAGYRVL